MDTSESEPHESVARDSRGRRIVKRRHRSIEEKRAIVAEAFAPGASAAAVARQYGVNSNLVFNWQRQQQRGLLESRTRRMSGRTLVPVKLLETLGTPSTGVRVEFGNGMQLHIGAECDAGLLARLMPLLRA
jgi:transposase